jgi:hypothetical protein
MASQVRAARARLAKRLKKGHLKRAVIDELTPDDTADGALLMSMAFMPEIVPSKGSALKAGSHFVYHPLPWLSQLAVDYLDAAAAHSSVYNDALPVVKSAVMTTNPAMLKVPATAPLWAIQDAEEAD